MRDAGRADAAPPDAAPKPDAATPDAAPAPRDAGITDAHDGGVGRTPTRRCRPTAVARTEGTPSSSQSSGTQLARQRRMLSTRIAVLVFVAGCSRTTDVRYVGLPLGQSTATGPREPSAPIAMTPDVPPPGPGMRISTPGGSAPAATGAASDDVSPATIAPRGTIAPAGSIAPRDMAGATPTTPGTDPSTGNPVVAPIAPAPTSPTAPTPPPPTGATPPNVGPGTGTGPTPPRAAPTRTTGATAPAGGPGTGASTPQRR